MKQNQLSKCLQPIIETSTKSTHDFNHVFAYTACRLPPTVILFFSPHSCWNFQRASRFPMLSKPASYQECSIFLFTLHFCKAVLKTCTRSNDHQARLGTTGKCLYCVFNLSAMGPRLLLMLTFTFPMGLFSANEFVE